MVALTVVTHMVGVGGEAAEELSLPVVTTTGMVQDLSVPSRTRGGSPVEGAQAATTADALVVRHLTVPMVIQMQPALGNPR
jgi:hypothetical protein